MTTWQQTLGKSETQYLKQWHCKEFAREFKAVVAIGEA